MIERVPTFKQWNPIFTVPFFFGLDAFIAIWYISEFAQKHTSNFERLLFELLERSSELTKNKMEDLGSNGLIKVSKDQLKIANDIFSSGKADMNDVNILINQVFSESGYLIDLSHSLLRCHQITVPLYQIGSW